MSAAIAYRTVFALAPILIIAISVAGWFLGSSELAQAELLEGIESIAGPEVAEAMASFLASAISSANTAAVIGFVLLLWTASSLFIELQHDLNDIFGVPYEKIAGLVALVRKRGIGFLWVFGLGLLMIAILLVNTVWGIIDSLLPANLEGLEGVVNVLAPIVSLILLPFVFGLIFKTLTMWPLCPGKRHGAAGCSLRWCSSLPLGASASISRSSARPRPWGSPARSWWSCSSPTCCLPCFFSGPK